MTKLADLKKRLMENPEFRAEYEALAPEFDIAEKLVKIRTGSRLTQREVAERMKTTQSAVARLESGVQDPSLSTLRAYAVATNTELVIEFRQPQRDLA